MNAKTSAEKLHFEECRRCMVFGLAAAGLSMPMVVGVVMGWNTASLVNVIGAFADVALLGGVVLGVVGLVSTGRAVTKASRSRLSLAVLPISAAVVLSLVPIVATVIVSLYSPGSR